MNQEWTLACIKTTENTTNCNWGTANFTKVLCKCLFLLRATSPCLLSEVQLCRLVLSVGCYLGGHLNLGTVWATWALSAVSSQWRIHGRRVFAGPASTSPWVYSSSLLALRSLSNLLCFNFFFFFAFMLVTARQGWRHRVHFFSYSLIYPDLRVWHTEQQCQ